jgi:hypothetical protein
VDEILQALPDFFVSRAGAHPSDVAMAAKIGHIEVEGCRVVLQQLDFANRNFIERMDAALGSGARVVAILTPRQVSRSGRTGKRPARYLRRKCHAPYSRSRPH